MTQVHLDWSENTAEPVSHADVFRLSRHCQDVVLDIGALDLHDLQRVREGDSVRVMPVCSVRLSADGLARLKAQIEDLERQAGQVVTVLPPTGGPAD